MSAKNVAVVGATGAVGTEFLEVLEKRNFPIKNLKLLASARSAGKTLNFKGEKIPVEELTHDAFKGVEIALFSAGASRSKEFAPSAVKAGAIVVDNSSAFRMDEGIPLVVPEVNPHRIREHKGIIANPNCSTIQMVVALMPLHRAATIKRVVVSTYQAVSGAGQAAMDECVAQTADYLAGKELKIAKFPYRIAFNLIPHIDVFQENNYTKEEMKMVYETRKIMEIADLKVSATCVRVPVLRAHSESINIQTEKKLTRAQALEILGKAEGVKVKDDPSQLQYPMPIDASGDYFTWIGRVREDISQENGLDIFVVADQLLKGAALNAVQIAERLL